MIHSKSGNPQLAIKSLKEAVRLNPTDAEAWSNLGGALRRVGMFNAPKAYDKESLMAARDSYDRAHTLERFKLYSALNVPRLDLLLSRWDSTELLALRPGFRI